MGIFWRKEKIIDLTEYSRRQKDKMDSLRQEISEAKKAESNEPAGAGGVFSFFSNIGANNASSSTTSSSSSDSDESSEDKKKKLAKRLVDMTSKIEDLSNQMYHLQQRLEVVERKLSINKF